MKSSYPIPPLDLSVNSFDDLRLYLEPYVDLSFYSIADLKSAIFHLSKVEAFISENMAWRYINATRFANSENHSKQYLNFVENVQPELSKFENRIARVLVNNPSFEQLKDNFGNYVKRISLSVEMFNEKNVELDTQQSILAKKYGEIQAEMLVEFQGQKLTLQQAGKLLKSSDRAIREEIYNKINARRLESSNELNQILDELIELRSQEAKNCGFENYRDYKHKLLGRFDYSVEKVLEFHSSIKKHAVPLQEKLDLERINMLKVDRLLPFDTSVNIYSELPLEPFKTGDELMEKAITCFSNLDPFFGECLSEMQAKGLVDLESREGKAPGGYNYPLDNTGYPFIFMNASGSLRDVTTMVHEGGHAIHSVLCKDLEINSLKHCPSEVAELASMSMELISMDYWNVFFDNEEDLIRAKIEQLDGVLTVLPWIAIVDKFQHWLYTNQNHTTTERLAAWDEIYSEFSSGMVDYTGFEDFKLNMWQRQLHIFEVPFYYIEYGIAQLGAIAIWRNYCQNPSKTINQYKDALKLGYTKPIPEIYRTAGIEFNFSSEYVKELLDFVWGKYEELVNSLNK
ncbi:MAG: M3 family oligoendopeptidase [Bacteroidetes bacterium]|nr:M3 family oligoendopeptidase [Bacteroidota bacterium]